MARNHIAGARSAHDLIFASGGEEARKRPSFWRRLLAAIEQSRQRTAEREIGHFIEMHGGQLTDDLERRISRKFGGPAGPR